MLFFNSHTYKSFCNRFAQPPTNHSNSSLELPPKSNPWKCNSSSSSSSTIEYFYSNADIDPLVNYFEKFDTSYSEWMTGTNGGFIKRDRMWLKLTFLNHLWLFTYPAPFAPRRSIGSFLSNFSTKSLSYGESLITTEIPRAEDWLARRESYQKAPTDFSAWTAASPPPFHRASTQNTTSPHSDCALCAWSSLA